MRLRLKPIREFHSLCTETVFHRWPRIFIQTNDGKEKRSLPPVFNFRRFEAEVTVAILPQQGDSLEVPKAIM